MRISDWSSDVCSSDLDDGPEIGAGWKRTGEKAGDYVSLQIDDPALALPIRANLFQSAEDKSAWSLHWNRPPKRGELDRTMSAPRHQTVVGRTNTVRLAAPLLLSGLLLAVPLSITPTAQDVPATRTVAIHPFAVPTNEAVRLFVLPAG